MKFCTGSHQRTSSGSRPGKRFRVIVAPAGAPRIRFTAIARSSADLMVGLIDVLPLGSFVSVRAL